MPQVSQVVLTAADLPERSTDVTLMVVGRNANTTYFREQGESPRFAIKMSVDVQQPSGTRKNGLVYLKLTVPVIATVDGVREILHVNSIEKRVKTHADAMPAENRDLVSIANAFEKDTNISDVLENLEGLF